MSLIYVGTGACFADEFSSGSGQKGLGENLVNGGIHWKGAYGTNLAGTHIVVPVDPVRGRAGVDAAVEVDVAALVDGLGRDGLAQHQLHVGGIWNEVTVGTAQQGSKFTYDKYLTLKSFNGINAEDVCKWEI